MHKPAPKTLARYEKAQIGYGDTVIFEALNLDLNAGEMVMFCGPNGCGKSTALKALRRLIHAKSGMITFGDKPLDLFNNKELARQMAMLTQAPSAPEELLVRELVEMGRFAHRAYLGSLTAKDREAVEFAIEACDLNALTDMPLGRLSGGQLQRSWLAMIIAQDAPVILLDEPTNHLDITHQIETLELVTRLNRKQGKTVIVVMHDLNLAARYADRMLLFKKGALFADGTPEKVMTEEIVSETFSIACRIVTDPVYGKPLCIPYPWHTDAVKERAKAERD